jgi:hypothetical protein
MVEQVHGLQDVDSRSVQPEGDAYLSDQSALLKEVEMLLHLPIVMLATLSPITVSDTVPKLNIAKECRFEGGTSAVFDRCSKDEADAFQQLQTEWPQFAEADRNSCLMEATVGGLASYVDLQICLEMARDVRNQKADTRDPLATAGAQSTDHPAQAEMSVVDKHH